MSQQDTMTIDPVIMLNAAQTVDAQRSIIENCLSSIIKDANSLKSVWEGESAGAYQEAIAKIEESSPNVVDVLKEYALDLNEIASQFISREAERERNNAALPNNVFGLGE